MKREKERNQVIREGEMVCTKAANRHTRRGRVGVDLGATCSTFLRKSPQCSSGGGKLVSGYLIHCWIRLDSTYRREMRYTSYDVNDGIHWGPGREWKESLLILAMIISHNTPNKRRRTSMREKKKGGLVVCSSSLSFFPFPLPWLHFPTSGANGEFSVLSLRRWSLSLLRFFALSLPRFAMNSSSRRKNKCCVYISW